MRQGAGPDRCGAQVVVLRAMQPKEQFITLISHASLAFCCTAYMIFSSSFFLLVPVLLSLYMRSMPKCSRCGAGIAEVGKMLTLVYWPADMRSDVQSIFRQTPHEKQVMMFSATLSSEIRPICKKFMSDVRPTLTTHWPPALCQPIPAGAQPATNLHLIKCF